MWIQFGNPKKNLIYFFWCESCLVTFFKILFIFSLTSRISSILITVCGKWGVWRSSRFEVLTFKKWTVQVFVSKVFKVLNFWNQNFDFQLHKKTRFGLTFRRKKKGCSISFQNKFYSNLIPNACESCLVTFF